MPTVDLIAGVLVALALAWGYWAGIARALTFAGFAAGAVAGALATPLLLNDGHDSSFALVFAVTGALIAGALLAAAVEHWALPLRRRDRRVTTVRAVSGALLAGLSGLAAVWLVAAVIAQVDAARDRIEDSTIIGQLDDVVRPPGPRQAPEVRPFDQFPIVEGPQPRISPVDPAVARAPPVRRADRRVVRIRVVTACGDGLGSGWIGANGVVVTNAHVISAAEIVSVQVEGFGEEHDATPIWFEPGNDLGLLRVPGLNGTSPLATVARPREGTAGAIIGFPLGRHRIRPARIGATGSTYRGLIQGGGGRNGLPRGLAGRLLTAFRGLAQPGNSGGPLVDAQGRVLATVAIANGDGESGYGVPNRIVRSALRRAGPRVKTGSCLPSSASSSGS